MSRPFVVWFLASANFAAFVVLLIATPFIESLPEAALAIYLALTSLALGIGILRLHRFAYFGLLGRVAFLAIFGSIEHLPLLTLFMLAIIGLLLRTKVRTMFKVNATLAPSRIHNADAFDQFMTEWKTKCVRGSPHLGSNKSRADTAFGNPALGPKR